MAVSLTSSATRSLDSDSRKVFGVESEAASLLLLLGMAHFVAVVSDDDGANCSRTRRIGSPVR